MANIAVFCGARENVDPHYIAESVDFGRLIAERDHTLVYGGGTFGLMGGVYRGVKEKGGKVIGVIPHFLLSKERNDDHAAYGTDLIMVETMDERKRIMFDRSDVVLMLPGGVGTLDEFFEIVSLVQLNRRNHKLGVLNTNGFYDDLFSLMKSMGEKGFIPRETLDAISVSDTPGTLLDSMNL